jgi:hypothetical protein
MAPLAQRALGWAGALAIGAVVVFKLGSAQGQHPPAQLQRVLGEVSVPEPVRAAPVPTAPPEPDVTSQFPDLTQTDPELGVAGGGESHCGPVAASNALFWLGRNGFERLLPDAGSDKQRQILLVRALASRAFMGTSAHSGTSATGLLKGLDLYLRSKGYRFSRLEYQGWRAHQLRYSTGVRVPEPAFLQAAIRDGGVALINVGWYRPGKKPGVYRRHGGHWLTVVSVREDSLVLHDPAPWSGNEPRAHRVRAEPLGEGWLIGEDGPFPSRGYRVLAGDLDVKRAGEVAIIDGAVALVAKPPDALASAP